MNPMQASAGRTVYGAGSYAPTKGRVSANGMQGYVQRQLRQQHGAKRVGGNRVIGRDGQSDTRSGLAQQALERKQGWNAQQPQGAGLHQQPHNGKGPLGQQPQGAGMHGFNLNAPAAAPAAPPSLIIRSNGTLELPYSPAWSQSLLAQMGQYNSDLLGLQQDQQAEGIDFARLTDQEKQGYVGQQRQTLNNASGSGTVFSTAYGTAALNDAKNHNNTINQLLSDHGAAQQAFDTERTSMISAFKQQMQQQALAYAEELAEKAGTLGYGNAVSKPPKHNHGGKGKGKGKGKR